MICGQLKQPEKQNQVTVTLPDKYFQRSLFLPKQHPVDETHLVVVRGGGLIHQEVSPECVNEVRLTECRS